MKIVRGERIGRFALTRGSFCKMSGLFRAICSADLSKTANSSNKSVSTGNKIRSGDRREYDIIRTLSEHKPQAKGELSENIYLDT